jgi:hypothetical protein
VVLGSPLLYGGSDLALVLMTVAVLSWPVPAESESVFVLLYLPRHASWIVDRPARCRLCTDGPLWFPHH